MAVNKYDKEFKRYTLEDLNALKPYILARLNDFIEAQNEEAIYSYTQIKEALDRAIAEAATKQSIRDAVWNGGINQISTREVAEQFECEITVARNILLDIVNGLSGDSRFVRNSERGSGVIISNGRTFDYSPMDMNGGGISKRSPKHYIWFVS